jgi:hypothetical protein
VNALCSNLPSRTYRLQAWQWHGMFASALAVASCPLPACLVPLCAMHGHRSIGMWMRRRTDKRTCALHALTETIDRRVRV